MLRLGNTVANEIFQESVPQHMEGFRINPDSTRLVNELYIYIHY